MALPCPLLALVPFQKEEGEMKIPCYITVASVHAMLSYEHDFISASIAMDTLPLTVTWAQTWQLCRSWAVTFLVLYAQFLTD